MAEYEPPYGSSGHKAYSRIYNAATMGYAGDYKKAAEHSKEAHNLVGQHLKELTEAGKHDEAKQFGDRAQRSLKRLDHLLRALKSHFKKSDSGYDPQYDYRHFRDLSPEDQEDARKTYGDRDMHAFLYPHHKENGRLVHTGRFPFPGAESPKVARAHEEFQAPKPMADHTLPQHKEGANVVIHSPGITSLHGKVGIVQKENPSQPGKITVRVKHADSYENVLVDPILVKLTKLTKPTKPTKPEEKKPEHPSLKKAMALLERHRKKGL